MKLPRLRAITLLVLSVACGKDPVGPPPRITALPRALTTQETRLIEADNRFAIKLLKQATADTRDTLPNLFVSPLSVAMALGMTYNGAAGTTEEAMRATLELDGMTLAEVNEANQSLIALLRGLDPRVQFQIANSIWYRNGFAVEQPFIDANRTYFDARVDSLDFTSAAAPVTINNWVSDQTKGLIEEIVESPLPDEALMYLINAIYFKGDWTRQFDQQLTAPRPFHLQSGSTVNVPTMTFGHEVDVLVGATAAGTVIDLPYGGAAFSMTILLPHEQVGLDSALALLTLDAWQSGISTLDTVRRQVYLPKFKLENSLTLVPTLSGLGMGIAFTDAADFTRMYRPGGILITDVRHRTYVDVNEEGTTAAAVTAVVVGPTSSPPVVSVDRPFIFALRENLSGTILFMGVIRHPTIE
ncbi:MAG: serpin family protein [Gemmatimonadales bacterium]